MKPVHYRQLRDIQDTAQRSSLQIIGVNNLNTQ